MKNNKVLNKVIIIGGCLLLAIIVLTGIFSTSSFAVDDTGTISDENKVEFKCNDFVSFNGELKCTVVAVIKSNQSFSALSLKLSDSPTEIVNLLDDKYESTIMNEGDYVDIILGKNIFNESLPTELNVAEIKFSDIKSKKLFSILQADYYDGGYEKINTEISVSNPQTEAPLVEFYCKNIPSGYKLIDDKYLFIPVTHAISGGKHILSDEQSFSNIEDFWNAIENDIKSSSQFVSVGTSYELVNKNGFSAKMVVTDDYGNKKEYKAIYVNSISNDYSLPWNSTENVYTRGLTSEQGIITNCYETNGFMSLEDNKIKIYGDNEHNDLIDSKNWYYLRSDAYDLTTKNVNIPNKVSYDEFMNNVKAVGVTIKILNSNGEEITSGYLDSTNTLVVSGVPGYDSENITINTEISDYIETGDLEIATVEDYEYIIYNIDAGTLISDILEKIDTNGNVTISDARGNQVDPSTIAKTNMGIHITINNKKYIYRISVIGDVTGNGEVYLGDIIKLYQFYRNTNNLTNEAQKSGDVVSDGKIDLLDIAKLYRYYRGVENSLK